jgi:Proline-rich nuclear receptor coactivator motif
MPAPLANPSQGPRRSPRRSKKDPAPSSAQGDSSNSETSPPMPAVKTASLKPPPTNGTNTQGVPSTNRKKSPGLKKHNNSPDSHRQTSHSQTSSQTNLLSPNKKATPLKQAYAGPTFHSSPAASSLPMPSFYSKSLPTVTASPGLTSTTQLDGQGHPDSEMETLMAVRSEESTPKGREPSPLDFMFEAARKARNSPKAQSPDFRAGRLSPFDDVPRNTSRTPGEPSSESVFPFELDGNGGRPMSIGPSFATPYKDRMDALRSPKTHSITSPQNLDEKERKEKSEALKRLLINASPLRSPNKPELNSYFPDRATANQPASPSLQRGRYHSGPTTPQSGIQHAPVPRPYFQNVPATTQERDPPIQRPVSSHLRREYQPDTYQSPAELDSDSGTAPAMPVISQNNHRSISGQNSNNFGGRSPYSNISSTMQTRSSHSSQKLEDDLRRVLKLDLTSSS